MIIEKPSQYKKYEFQTFNRHWIRMYKYFTSKDYVMKQIELYMNLLEIEKIKKRF